MSIRTNLASITGQGIKTILNLRGKSKGETAPGLVALKIDPHFVQNRHKNFHTKIIISGTNGKTTTTAMIAKILKNAQIDFITNPSG